MPYLLNLVYLALLIALSPWLLWSAIRKGKYREGYAQKLFGRAPRRDGTGQCVWLHAVSVGEVNLLQPLVRQLRQQWPDAQFVLSTTTRTGLETAGKKFPELTVFYCPLDFTWAVKNALTRLRPGMLVLAELELWPNLVREAKRRGVRVAVVNGRLSERSARGYMRVGWFIRRLLHSVDVIGVQTEEYAHRFIRLGALPETTVVTGSMKFDGACTDRTNGKTRKLSEVAGLASSDVVFLAGSTQAPEEQLALEAYRQLKDEFPQLRLILVPRHPERFGEVAALLDRSGLSWQRRSELENTGAARARVLLVDTMGELSAWWGTAHIGFVGGSMGHRGGQSMIEPAAYGVAVSFGPNTHNFRDVVRLLREGNAAVEVQDGGALTEFVRCCLRDERYRQALGDQARRLVTQQLGATDKTTAMLSGLAARRAA